MTPPIPDKLYTDEDWAKLSAWLQHHRLVLHIPKRGEIWLERKRDDQK